MFKPFEGKLARIAAMDPGSFFTGYSILDVWPTGRTVLVHNETFDLMALLKANGMDKGHMPNKFYRLKTMEKTLGSRFLDHKPNMVGSEAPFMKSRFVTAFASLTECVAFTRNVVYDYDEDTPLYMVEPSVAKVAVGVDGRSRDKVAVQQALYDLPLELSNGITIEGMDEHSSDSVAIGWHIRNCLLACAGLT